MKKFIIVSLALFALNASASCQLISSLSSAVMKARQAGVSKEHLVMRASDAPESIKPLYLGLIDDAYKTPVMKSKEDADREVRKYEGEMLALCVGGLLKNKKPH